MDLVGHDMVARIAWVAVMGIVVVVGSLVLVVRSTWAIGKVGALQVVFDRALEMC